MGLVVDFPKVEANHGPDAELIEMLEGLLQRARSGELRSGAIVLADGNGTPTIALRMDPGAAPAIIGGLTIAAAKIARLVETELA